MLQGGVSINKEMNSCVTVFIEKRSTITTRMKDSRSNVKGVGMMLDAFIVGS